MRPADPRNCAGAIGPTIALVAVGLLLAACTDGRDPDFAAPDGTTGDETTSDASYSGEPIDEARGHDRSGGGADGRSTDGHGGRSDDARPIEPNEIDTPVDGDPEIAEGPAAEPRPDDGPDRDDQVTPAPQADLGPGESVLCATVEIGLDAATDGAPVTMRTQRAKLIDGAASVADADLRGLLGRAGRGDRLDEDVLRAALDRCKILGYRT